MSIELYRKRMWDLLLDRPLSQHEESIRVSELDDIWNSLSSDEQDLLEEEFAIVPDAPEKLDLVDQPAGDGVVPRCAGHDDQGRCVFCGDPKCGNGCRT